MKVYSLGLHLINLHSIHFTLMNTHRAGLNTYEHINSESSVLYPGKIKPTGAEKEADNSSL